MWKKRTRRQKVPPLQRADYWSQLRGKSGTVATRGEIEEKKKNRREMFPGLELDENNLSRETEPPEFTGREGSSVALWTVGGTLVKEV